MNIIFPPVDENFIKAKVEEGYYTNATELVRDAVRRLREMEDSRHSRLEAALEEGERAIREGRTVLYTPDLLDRITREAIQQAKEGRKPNPDVCPDDEL